MNAITFAFDCLSSWTVAPLVKRVMNDADEFAITNYDKMIIWHPKKKELEGFVTCSIEALKLIENHYPRLYSVVSEELEYIIGQPRCKKALARYTRSIRSGTLYWSHFKKYSNSTQIKVMAGAIVHEAYHGKCYDIFGINAYVANQRMERICRNREVRFLKRISKDLESNTNDSINNRIEMLSAPIT